MGIGKLFLNKASLNSIFRSRNTPQVAEQRALQNLAYPITMNEEESRKTATKNKYKKVEVTLKFSFNLSQAYEVIQKYTFLPIQYSQLKLYHSDIASIPDSSVFLFTKPVKIAITFKKP